MAIIGGYLLYKKMKEKCKFTIGVFGAIFNSKKEILCVKRAYSPFTWTTPGGAVDEGETLKEALKREVREETGFLVEPVKLLGAYLTPQKSDIAFSVKAEITRREDWVPGSEIEKVSFFKLKNLPKPMNSRTIKRIEDAFSRKEGVIYTYN